MLEQKSKLLWERSKIRIPGGVNSPVRAFKSVHRTPIFIEKAQGSKIYDVDGNEYIDYVCSWGPEILGHSEPNIVKAVQESAIKGLTYGAPTEKEIILAELVSELMPVMEVMRLVNSGTEAVMSAIRVARGFTKRDYIVKFQGCYHGHSDGLLVQAGSGLLTTSVPNSAGVPEDYVKNTLIATYNDSQSVENLFKKYGDRIAAIIVEPVAANMGIVLPQEGFLQYLRDITVKYDALLIFDEVITGFRLSLGGACEYFGIEPDLVTLGKIIGGGMPVGAYGGRREIMKQVSPDGNVYQAGTLSGNPIATAAGIAMLTMLKNTKNLYSDLSDKGYRIASAMRKSWGDAVSVNQIGSLLSVFFTKAPVTNYESASKSNLNAFSKYFSYMLDNGLYIPPSQFESLFISSAHTDLDIDKTCEIIASYKLSDV